MAEWLSNGPRPLSPEEVHAIRELVERHLLTVERVIEPAMVLSGIAEVYVRTMEQQGVPLARMLEEASRAPETLADAVARYGLTAEQRQVIEYARRNVGVHLSGFTDALRARVVTTVNTGMRAGMSADRIAQRLFRDLGDFNRDWRMIAVTETATCANNGFIASRPIGSYVIGISRADACAWCATHVHGKVLRVVEPPRIGEGRDWDNEVWVGKSNVGRYQSTREQETGRVREDWELWKPASGANHPHCRCRWAVFDPRIHEVAEDGTARLRSDL